MGREWRRFHLRGAYWWEGTSYPSDRDREIPRAEQVRTETEDGLTKLLEEGWHIVSVVSARPVALYSTRVGRLCQEAFNVFVERVVEDPNAEAPGLSQPDD
jgi:hypothetical protein